MRYLSGGSSTGVVEILPAGDDMTIPNSIIT